jgi:hypothetical protein
MGFLTNKSHGVGKMNAKQPVLFFLILKKKKSKIKRKKNLFYHLAAGLQAAL